MKPLLTALSVALAALAVACADPAPEEHVAPESDEIVGGKSAASARFDAIGTIGNVYTGGLFDAFCTGTLIAPDLVVTAKHCAQAGTDEAPYVKDQDIAFAIGGDASHPSKVIKAKDVRLAANNTGGFIGFGSDVAVYVLSEPVTSVTPARVATSGLGASDVGKTFLAMGFGAQDFEGKHRGTRRVGQVTLRAVSGSPMKIMFRTEAAFFSHIEKTEGAPWVSDQRDELSQFFAYDLLPNQEVHVGLGNGDAQPCDGDSGGPLLRQVGKEFVVYAVVSGSKKGKDGRCSVLGETYATLNAVPELTAR